MYIFYINILNIKEEIHDYYELFDKCLFAIFFSFSVGILYLNKQNYSLEYRVI